MLSARTGGEDEICDHGRRRGLPGGNAGTQHSLTNAQNSWKMMTGQAKECGRDDEIRPRGDHQIAASTRLSDHGEKSERRPIQTQGRGEPQQEPGRDRSRASSGWYGPDGHHGKRRGELD
jgi:hypothetical protein